MNQHQGRVEEFRFDDDIVRKFAIATLVWGAVAFLVGVIAAFEMAWWPLNLNLEWITFGRLRPLHTNAAIFAFAGNAIFAGIYHSTQRLLKTRLFNDLLSRMHFWGWQLIIVSAALTLPFGFTTGKEYAELEWPIDIAIAVVWVIFAVNFFGTIAKRREKHMYVAIWFYIATIVTVAVLHITNSLEIPISFLKSYSIYAGIQDAMIQWWYGHNAVAFFLTTPFLGLMYYYMPKVVNRPVYSYRLSIVHFWALVFLYIWAGPHHLLNTSVPDWAQTLGMIFSLMLWAPSWGGMINGLLTLRGAWHLLRTDPVVKFLVTAITFYGMSTFEGPLLSIKSVSALAHYTDWIIGHVHGGTLGWNGFFTFGMLYYLVPKLWNTKLYSEKLATTHFWTGLTGILIYYISMWASGITQGLMWKAVGADGKLVYPDFVETVTRIIPLYWTRALGGTLFLVGFLLMLYNMYKTIQGAAVPEKDSAVMKAVNLRNAPEEATAEGHRKLEGLGTIFTVLALVAILVGSVIELYPTFNVFKYVPQTTKLEPYTPLELLGRDVYVKEGCYVCHSQQIRTMASEVLRYGPASTIEESMYDHPFQWGSKRTGPDLAREGKKYPDLWHYNHMMNPRSVTQKSIMPNYSWLSEKTIEFMSVRSRLSAMKFLGVPYDDATVANGDVMAEKQAKEIADGLAKDGAPAGLEHKEIVALIAYLQSLGQKLKENTASPAAGAGQ
jgi:cytochrome c oxidase cbb3-type subunit I/II